MKVTTLLMTKVKSTPSEEMLERLGRPICGWCGASNPKPSVHWQSPTIDMMVCISCNDQTTRPAQPCIHCSKQVTTMDIDGNPWCGC